MVISTKEDELLLLFIGLLLFFSLPYPSQFTGQATSGVGTVTVSITGLNASEEGNVSGSGAFGGGGEAGSFDFLLSPSSFVYGSRESEPVHLGDSLRGQLRLENVGALTHTFVVSSNKDFVTFTPDHFTLRPGETVVISLFFSVQREGISVAKITLQSDYATLQIPVVITTRSPDADFDVELVVPPAFRTVAPGGKIYSQVLVFGLTDEVTNLQYSLRDSKGSIVLKENERVAARDGEKREHLTAIPATMKEGVYVFGVTVTHDNADVSASVFVRVKEGVQPQEEIPSPVVRNQTANVLLVFFLVLSLTLVHYFYRRKVDRA